MLARCAVHVEHSRGHRFTEPHHPYRNDFQRDATGSSRPRLSPARSQTQVFTRRYSDHFRNRLTHTLEVSQVSRTIAGALGLNVDLAEALALVHDIGHPPFGHAGKKLSTPPWQSKACPSTTIFTPSALSKISNSATPPSAA